MLNFPNKQKQQKSPPLHLYSSFIVVLHKKEEKPHAVLDEIQNWIISSESCRAPFIHLVQEMKTQIENEL